MNELVIPPSPNWYRNSVIACSPDNTLVYGSKNDIVIVKEKKNDEPAEVKIISVAHAKTITSVSLNKKWKDPHTYVVSLGEENAIKVWDLETLEKKFTNKDHMEHQNPVIGAVFAGDDRVVSAASNGFVIVWNINTNESRPLPDLFNFKVTLTCLSSCPHAGWLLAFGLNNGCVVVTDLRRNGQILYKLRGHYQAVVSLSWCPAPVNIFPKNTQSKVGNKSLEIKDNTGCEQKSNESPEIKKDIENEKVTKTPGKKPNPWVNLVHADDGDNIEKKDSLTETVENFLEECDSLKSKILGLEVPQVTSTVEQKIEPKSVIEEIQQVESRITDEESEEGVEQKVEPKSGIEEIQKVVSRITNEESEEGVEQKIEPKSVSEEIQKVESRITDEESEEGVEQKVEPKSGIEEIQKVESRITNEESEEGASPIIEEKGIEDTAETEICQNLDEGRPLPTCFDPSDFEDSLFEGSIFEDKDVGNEKHMVKDSETKENNENLDNNPIVEDKKIELSSGSEIDEVSDEEQKKIALDVANKEKNVEILKVDETSKTEKHEDEAAPKIEEPDQITEEIMEEPRNEYLLASAGRDQTVYIWRAGTDGRMQTFFHAGKKPKTRDAKNQYIWLSICWIAPNILLTTSLSGEVLAWYLPKPKESNKQFKIVHYEHSSTIFNVVGPPRYLSKYNWRDEVDLSIWSWGHDGLLVNFDINSNKIRFCFSTIQAPVISFDSSSLDPNRLAVATRDGSIYLWYLSLPHLNIITMQKWQKKITNKVSAIAWHPTKEMLLGFGTEEGRVGFIDMTSKKSSLLPNYFRTQVYKIEWGPLNGDTNDLGLYVVAEGKLVIYDTKELNGDPIHLELGEKLYIYKFSWKPDFSLLLVNTKDGSLIVLNTDLTPITTIYLSDRGLNTIVWHPDAFTDQIDISPRCHWFGATTPKGFLVYDCKLFKENPSPNENFMDKIIVCCEGHLKPTLYLAWSPFNGNWIASRAADGLIHVWDVISKTVISTWDDPYLPHNGALIWSPIDADLVITGDKVIRIWSASKNPPKIDDEFMTARKNYLNKKLKTEKPEPEKAEKSKIKIDVVPIKKSPKNCIVPSFYVSSEENLNEQIANMRKIANWDHKSQGEDYKKVDPLHLFGTKEQVTQLLTANYEQQKKEGKHKSCELIALWKGDISDLVKEAINENTVTPSMITLAPMVSSKMWQDACEAYAKKLSESADSDPLQVAMYLLACHKVEEAVHHLCLNLMFREALALVKYRFPENSEIVKEVTIKWAQHCIVTGNFETAAYCYISLGHYEDAAKVLSRRNNKEFLEFAAELAEKEGNRELCNSIKFKFKEIQKQDETTSDVKDLPSRVDAILNDGKQEENLEEVPKLSSLNTGQNFEQLEENSALNSDQNVEQLDENAG